MIRYIKNKFTVKPQISFADRRKLVLLTYTKQTTIKHYQGLTIAEKLNLLMAAKLT